MMSTITSVISIIRALVDFWRMVQKYQREQVVQKAEERAAQVEQAVEKSKKAESEDEIWATQDRIVTKRD